MFEINLQASRKIVKWLKNNYKFWINSIIARNKFTSSKKNWKILQYQLKISEYLIVVRNKFTNFKKNFKNLQIPKEKFSMIRKPFKISQ